MYFCIYVPVPNLLKAVLVISPVRLVVFMHIEATI